MNRAVALSYFGSMDESDDSNGQFHHENERQHDEKLQDGRVKSYEETYIMLES